MTIGTTDGIGRSVLVVVALVVVVAFVVLVVVLIVVLLVVVLSVVFGSFGALTSSSTTGTKNGLLVGTTLQHFFLLLS